MRAGQGLSSLGYDVRHQTTASAKGIQGQRTADLHVDGLGSVDVYTPQSLDPTKIVLAKEKKANQAGGGWCRRICQAPTCRPFLLAVQGLK